MNYSPFVRVPHVIWILIAACSLEVASATSVVTLIDKKKHRVIVAADSLISREDVGGKSRNACKIIELPDCVFATAGVYNITGSRTDFHLEALARKACESSGDIRDRADAFINISEQPVRDAVSHIRIQSPEYYKENVALSKQDFVDAIFVGSDHFGIMHVSARAFRVNENGDIRSVSYDESETDPDSSNFMFFAGVREDIDAFLRRPDTKAYFERTVARA